MRIVTPNIVLAAASLLVPVAAVAAPKEKERSAAAGLTAAIFSDHMVLQRQTEVPVWGTTAPGGTVTVTFMKQAKTVTADAQGRWMARLDKMEAVKEPQEMTVKDARETRVFKDVLVGEVWLCSGQSNMEWGSDWSEAYKKRKNKLKEGEGPATSMGFKVDGPTREVMKRAVGNPMIRVSSKTRDHLVTKDFGWEPVDEKNVITISALATCVAVVLQQELDVPVGIVVRSESGTALIEWISLAAFKADPLVAQALERAGKTATTEDPEKKWSEYVRATVPYAIRGFLWDQGEWGVGVKQVGWPPAMHALITTWRQAWGQGDLFWSATDHYDENLEERVRQSGIVNFAVAKTGGLGGGLHPVNKWQYAQKHLDIILPQVYGRPAPKWPPYPKKGK